MLNRILPAIGHIRLDKLQPHHLVELYADMGNDVNKLHLTYLPTEKLFETFEHLGWTMDSLSQMSGLHINTVYSVYQYLYRQINDSEITASNS